MGLHAYVSVRVRVCAVVVVLGPVLVWAIDGLVGLLHDVAVAMNVGFARVVDMGNDMVVRAVVCGIVALVVALECGVEVVW